MDVLKTVADGREPSSFRDPSGFLFYREGVLYRFISPSYKEAYDRLTSSGLYQELFQNGWLIGHEEISLPPAEVPSSEAPYKIIKPQVIPFTSYPYEWCYSQLQKAALLTLQVQRAALRHGMTLKDSSAYNVQFVGSRPIFIDTLSFEPYREGTPWVGYRQFCQHFLAPLLLISMTDARLIQMLRIHMDGIPLNLARPLLPLRSYLHPAILMHLHLHGMSQKKFADRPTITRQDKGFSRLAFLGLIDSLEGLIRKLKWHPPKTPWSQYYEATNYTEDASAQKAQIVENYLSAIKPKMVWDLGANRGLYSRIPARAGIITVALDSDEAAVELNYLDTVRNQESHLLPLVMDLMNPSAQMGWAHEERMSLERRGPADCILALALIHHLAIANNLPLDRIAEYLSRLCRNLVIEFVPKSDSQVKRLLLSRPDVFPHYDQKSFEALFSKYFAVRKSEKIGTSERVLYWMERDSSRHDWK